jgi:hypothetical protein
MSRYFFQRKLNKYSTFTLKEYQPFAFFRTFSLQKYLDLYAKKSVRIREVGWGGGQETRGDIFRQENPSVWQIPMFSQIFPMKNMGRICAKRL